MFDDMQQPHPVRLSELGREELNRFVTENVSSLAQEEALSVIANRYVTAPILGKLAQDQRLTGFYAVRLALVGHRQTPLAHAVKLVHYLYWFDLIELSVNVQVPAQVRRAVDTQLVNKVNKLSLDRKS